MKSYLHASVSNALESVNRRFTQYFRTGDSSECGLRMPARCIRMTSEDFNLNRHTLYLIGLLGLEGRGGNPSNQGIEVYCVMGS